MAISVHMSVPNIFHLFTTTHLLTVHDLLNPLVCVAENDDAGTTENSQWMWNGCKIN